MTTDTKSAAGFYTKVAGWKTKTWEQNPSYTMFTAKGRPMAGLMALPEPNSPLLWLVYIGTPNVDETARQAEGLGGKVVKRPEDIPTIGRFAIVQDPQGALFVAFTPLPGSTPPPDGAVVVGDFSWHELVTTDWRAALAFYKTLFGWEETDSMDMGPEMGTYQMYGWKGHMLGGMMNKPKQSPGPPAWLSYISVPDAKKAAATVTKLGGKIINGPMEVPGGSWIAAGLDLQGAAFAVHSPKPVSKKGKPRKAKSKPRKAKPARRAAARKPAAKRTMKPRKRAASRKKR
ncbi:MAG TPA: VOC family protein [Vicinamibacterales bacterium]